MTRPVDPGQGGPEEEMDDMLMALADGELPPATAMRLRSRIIADPGLAARHAAFEATAQALRGAFDPGPVPDRLLRTVLETPMGETPANVIPLPRPRSSLARSSLARMAIAASVVLALATGFLAGRALDPTAPLLQTGPAALQAAVALATTPTGGEAALPDGGSARVLGSFDTDLGLCRMLALDLAGSQDRAIVCGGGTDWTVAMTVLAGDGRGFTPASDMVAEMIDGYLDRIGASAALSPEQEAARLAP